jgi:putative Ca2+/H+ antiporter (TMEM165/GDT1 family)
VHAFFIALFIVFVAEMGDKTQFITLTFATRYSAKVVMAAVLAATLGIHLISVVVGEVLGLALPVFWINIIAGVCFIGFGIWMLKGGAEEAEEGQAAQSRFGPFLTVMISFFLAEMGDRTMIATVVIASREKNFLGVWLGSTTGMVAANAIAIAVGKFLGDRLSARFIKYGASLTFIASGVFAFVQAFRG